MMRGCAAGGIIRQAITESEEEQMSESKEQGNSQRSVSRRAFLGLGAVAGVTAMGSGLVGCAPKSSSGSTSEGESAKAFTID